MDYNFELQHKPGKTMIPADALSRRHDHATNIKDDEEIVGLPEELWIGLLDIDLRDAVVTGQRSDVTAQEALSKLQDSSNQSEKWSLEEGPSGSCCLFYNGKMYVPDDLDLRRRIVSDHDGTLVAGHPWALATPSVVHLPNLGPGSAAFIT